MQTFGVVLQEPAFNIGKSPPQNRKDCIWENGSQFKTLASFSQIFSRSQKKAKWGFFQIQQGWGWAVGCWPVNPSKARLFKIPLGHSFGFEDEIRIPQLGARGPPWLDCVRVLPQGVSAELHHPCRAICRCFPIPWGLLPSCLLLPQVKDYFIWVPFIILDSCECPLVCLPALITWCARTVYLW